MSFVERYPEEFFIRYAREIDELYATYLEKNAESDDSTLNMLNTYKQDEYNRYGRNNVPSLECEIGFYRTHDQYPTEDVKGDPPDWDEFRVIIYSISKQCSCAKMNDRERVRKWYKMRVIMQEKPFKMTQYYTRREITPITASVTSIAKVLSQTPIVYNEPCMVPGYCTRFRDDTPCPTCNTKERIVSFKF